MSQPADSTAEGSAIFRAEGRPALVELARVVPRSLAFARRASRPADGPVPALRRTPLTLMSVAVDELVTTAAFLAGRANALEVDRLLDDHRRAVDVLATGGYLADPVSVHPAPEAPTATRVTTRRALRVSFEHVSFPSTYVPPAGLPRREEWLADESNRIAHAYVLRHDEKPRPWIVVVHGQRMGESRDIRFMGSLRLFRDHGFNVVHPVLPMHGPRSRAQQTEPFPSIDAITNLYAMSQAVLDIRQLIAWLRRDQGATDIALYGASLGGHTSALVASLEPGLACVIAGIPTVDFSRLIARIAARYVGGDAVAESHMLEESVQTVNRLVSPLTFEPQLPHDRRFIFASVGDRITTPDQAVELWSHWGQPEIAWIQGSHIMKPPQAVQRFVVHALRSSDLIEGGDAWRYAR